MNYVNMLVIVVSGLILVPLTLEFISFKDYGYWVVIGEFLTWLVMLDPGIGVAIKQKVAVSLGRNDFASIGYYLSSFIIILFLLLIAFVFGGVVIYYNLNSILSIDSNTFLQLRTGIFWGIAGTILAMLSYPISSFNSGLLSSLGVGFFDIGSSLVRVASTIILLKQGYSFEALGLGILFGGGFLFCANAWYLLDKSFGLRLKLKFDKKVFKELVGLMGYSFLGSLSQVILRNSNLFLINKFLGPESAGILKINQTVPELGRQVLERPIMSMNASISHLQGEGNEDTIKKILTKYFSFLFIALGLFLLLVVSFSKSFISLWIDVEKYAGIKLIVLISIALGIRLVASTFSNILFSLGLLRENNIVLFLKSIIYLAAAVLTVTHLGVYGIFYSIIFSEIIVSMLYYPFRLYQKFKFDAKELAGSLKDFVIILVCSFALIVASLILNLNYHSWVELISGLVAAILCYALLLIAFLPMVRKEIVWLHQFIK